MAVASRKKKTESPLNKILAQNMFRKLFPSHLELVPQLNETYELELAFLESQVLDDDGILRNGAYFSRVGDQYTRHFLICSGEPVKLPEHSSSRLRSFFKTNQFKTGYATHGLFPYRGKFHPQMIKGIINAMGLKPGETILDPMMGSGTVLIEARLMGIKSIGIDASPFCRFMAQSKLDGLTVSLQPIRDALAESENVFAFFQNRAGSPVQGSKIKFETPAGLFEEIDKKSISNGKAGKEYKLPKGCNAPTVYNFLLLAYLDSAGYSERSNRKSPYDQFRAILERYLFVAEKIQHVLAGAESELADAEAKEGDARSLSLEDSSVDGIVFSPPYSFAIDYLENDSFHLGFMGVDLDELRSEMVGLRGRNDVQKFEFYKSDMEKVMSECARVLRPNRICSIIVGTNNNQLSKVQGVPPEQVEGIDEMLVRMGAEHGLVLVRKLSRQITGMANTMRTEYILMLEKRV